MKNLIQRFQKLVPLGQKRVPRTQKLVPEARTSSAHRVRRGFTVTEITIAIAFIGMLLIAIAVITTNVLSIYRKGSTIKAVNNVGRSLVDNFTSAINSAPSIDTTSLCSSLVSNDTAAELCRQDEAYGYIFHANYGGGPGDLENAGKQYNGIFCTGNYSYLWNTYYGQEAGARLQLTYRDRWNNIQTISANDLRLVRVKDPTYRVCSSVMSENYQLLDTFETEPGNTVTIDIRDLAHSTAATMLPNPIEAPETGMLTGFDTDLMLYELTVFPVSQDWVTLRTFMSGNFILATVRGDVEVTRTDDYCQASIANNNAGDDSSSMFDLGTEFNYCAINKFNFAARTAGV